MEEEDNDDINAPFPQANDFEKVIKLIKVEKENYLQDNDYLVNLLGISQRQVNYYLAACAFLGIINSERLFTEYGSLLRNKGRDDFISCISMKITSLPVFGETFFSRFLYDEDLSKEDIGELVSLLYGITNQGVAERRASTVKNWINWIFEQRNQLF